MATVQMTKDGKTADIYDSDECIQQAKRDGWTLSQEKPPAPNEPPAPEDADGKPRNKKKA